MKIKNNCIELSVLESVLCLKRRICFGEVEREEVVEAEKLKVPLLRWPGTHIPKVITVGTFYDVPKKEVVKALALLLFYTMIFAFLTYLLDKSLLIYLLILYFLSLPLALYPSYRLTKTYPKEFWIVRGKAKKLRIIYPRNSEYRRIVIGE